MVEFGEGRHYSCRCSCGGSVVLVDEAAKAVATVDLALRRFLPSLFEFGRPEFKGAMGVGCANSVMGDLQGDPASPQRARPPIQRVRPSAAKRPLRRMPLTAEHRRATAKRELTPSEGVEDFPANPG